MSFTQKWVKNLVKFTGSEKIFKSNLKVLTLIRLGGGTRSHHWRYPFTISKWFQRMISLLVTMKFRTFPEHRSTQFSNFFAQVWKFCNFSQQDSIDFQKKKKKKNRVFSIFLERNHTFLLEFECYVKNTFFWGIACWNGSKITKFGIFAHFSSLLTIFSIFTVFFMKKKSKKSVKWAEINAILYGNIIFELKLALGPR